MEASQGRRGRPRLAGSRPAGRLPSPTGSASKASSASLMAARERATFRLRSPGSELVLEFLIEAGADPMAGVVMGETPLHHAAVRYWSDDTGSAIRALIAAGADVAARDNSNNTPLQWVARRNQNSAVIKALLAAGADVNALNAFNETPLHGAAERGNPAVIEAMLAVGADPMARNDWGNTPLHRAASWNDNPAVIAALVAVGADVTVRDDSGTTPLHEAADRNDNPAVLEFLIETGANPMARTDEGLTPLHEAAWATDNPAVIIEVLLAAGADLMARDENENTPLHLAANFPKDSRFVDDRHAGDAIEALLAAGADPTARNAAGETPWDLAEANEALHGSDAYWRLNDARFAAPGGAARGTPPPPSPAPADTAAGPALALPASGGACQVPNYPSPPGGVANLGFSWCPASVGMQRRAFALQAAGAQCAIATGSSSTPEQLTARRQEIQAVCDTLDVYRRC